MKLTNLLTSQKLSKRLDKLLKEKGIEVESQFVWSLSGTTSGKRRLMSFGDAYLRESDIPAFLSGELGERLKKHISTEHFPVWDKFDKVWFFMARHKERRIIETKHEAEARGLLYEYLLKNNLISGERGS